MTLFVRVAVLALVVSAAARAEVHQILHSSLARPVASVVVGSVVLSPPFDVPSLQGAMLYIDREAMLVLATSIGGLDPFGQPARAVTVIRAQLGTAAALHVAGAMVLYGQPGWFFQSDHQGDCTGITLKLNFDLNVLNGRQWICSSISHRFVPGFENTSLPAQLTALVQTNQILIPSGPLFHVLGSDDITFIAPPAGFEYGTFCAIPDTVFTTNSNGNIAVASVAVKNKLLCWTYDDTTGLFVPSY
jgi:hypothetical protein